MSDEHAYNGNLEYAKNLTIRLGKLFGIFGLALYALESVAFTLRRFSELLSFEKRGLADIAAALTQPRAEPITLATVLLVGLGVVICILSFVYLVVVVEKWVKRIIKEWVKVVNCAWLKSVKDFFLCLAGALFTLVETVVFVLITFLAIIVGAINIAILIWFIPPEVFGL
ncbi:MAG: hypothetical protein AB1429_16600 [Pseudomonadota bacterium]|jgi:hypothetical protein